MPEELKELVRDYFSGKISRREFIGRTALLTGSLAASSSISVNALAAPVPESTPLNDTSVRAQDVRFNGSAGPIFGYFARPTRAGPFAALILIHANQGLNDHIRNVARRLAEQGYATLAPDYLSRHGGTSKVNPRSEGLSNIRELAPWNTVAEDTDAGCNYLRALSEVNSDRLGLLGFCWGGEMAFAAATAVRGLRAVAVFYGRSPKPLELVNNIEAPVIAHYGEKDPGVNQDIPATEEAMRRFNKPYDFKIYSDAQHGFYNETTPDRFHPAAADEAWKKTLELFKKQLQS
jgi:carboxymethylenebutenolidase